MHYNEFKRKTIEIKTIEIGSMAMFHLRAGTSHKRGNRPIFPPIRYCWRVSDYVRLG